MPAPLMDPHLGAAIYGDPVLLGTIDASTTAKTNAEATSPFGDSGELLKGKLLCLQCLTSAFHVRQVAASTGDATTSDLQVPAGQFFYMNMRSSKGYISVILPSGTANVRVYEMNG